MIAVHPQYITDSRGRKKSVVLSMKEFKAIMEQLDELEDIRLYDEAKQLGDTAVPLDEAFMQIEANRKGRS